ncbi:MAG: carboxymuconolactone decarboxylase family protein [Candidatus Schekmanbacteria bacterium]|nr:carboxymuconolactone decarboxylase family protein [Candidatus Schekmanbacteria bacterium]
MDNDSRHVRAWPAQPYTTLQLVRTMKRQAPPVLRNFHALAGGFRGDDRLTADQRLAMQIRLAKIMGCPVCLWIFPRLAHRRGMAEQQLRACLDGVGSALEAETAAVADWAEAVLLGDGATPPVIPSRCAILNDRQRAHIQAMTRVEMCVHSVGLAFLPNAMIERSRSR